LGLGRVSFDPGCEPAVREDFERALALLHHMTYPAAYAAFEDVVERDERCALGYWGMAMTLFQPLWPNRPTASDLDRGWELVQTGRSHVRGTLDGLFVQTAEAFFDPGGAPDYWTRIGKWRDATRTLHEAYPEVLDVMALEALSTLATASLDGEPARSHAQAAEILARVLLVEPDHPGAVHYTIHANDFVARADLALDVVRRYGEIAPRNPHALHMPTHIFVRLGLWGEVIDWNRRAASAALAQPAGQGGEYVWDEYPHAIEYLVYAHLQRADDRAAQQDIDEMHGTPALEPTFKTAFHLASTRARYALERQAWSEAAALPVRTPEDIAWELYPWPEAITWFARGLGSVHLDDLTGAGESLRQLERLRDVARRNGEEVYAGPIEVMRLELAGWTALGSGASGEAIERMTEAVHLERTIPKHPVTPGATLPAGELLGDLYLLLEMPEQAREAYQASNESIPGRFNTVLGLARANLRMGERTRARDFYRQLIDLTVDGASREGVGEASRFLAQSGDGARHE
jgi:tetratricopeptide (TPR) repeat protein